MIAEFGVNTWVEGLFALTGVRLDVAGEQHLASQRPAVFMFNHRNNFDPYVAIKLVRHDWGSVAKKEIAGPLTPLMQLAHAQRRLHRPLRRRRRRSKGSAR